MTSYLIIGAGNFGAGTALSLIQRQGTSKVTLIDTTQFPNPRAASHDVNKIVRDDYPDKLYMRMLKRAMPMWRNHDLYKQWYHEVGMLRADPSNFGAESISSYKALGIENSSHFLPVEEVRKRWNGVFATANFDGLDKILYNPSVGFAEADKALGAVIQQAVNLGVGYVVGAMSRLSFGRNGECVGVTLESGETLHADKILLATGARTASLLVQSAPQRSQLHAGNRVLATGAITFWAKVQGSQKEKLSVIPVLKNCLPQVKGKFIATEEAFPYGKENGLEQGRQTDKSWQQHRRRHVDAQGRYSQVQLRHVLYQLRRVLLHRSALVHNSG